MPWKEVTTMSEKKRFIELTQVEGADMSALCRTFGISRKTGYKLISRYQQEGLAGLMDRSRKPHLIHQTPPETENLVLSIRHQHSAWGGEKIRQYLQNQGYDQLPTEKTIDRILKRHGLITAEESEKHTAWKRFEHENPNDLWQMDFKGYFLAGSERCYPLTLLDDHSRFSLSIKACANQTTETVKNQLIYLFRRYGMPKRMTMDNGTPWGYSGTQMHTKLTAWLIRLGIYVSHSRPNHPQTQGKLERFHRTLKLELLSRFSFGNLDEAQEGFDWWQRIYNEERPHGALELAVPLQRYKKSERDYPEEPPAITYEDGLIIRKVQQKGYIFFKGKIFRIGEAFYGQPVGLKETEDGQLDVYYCAQKINQIDLRYPYR